MQVITLSLSFTVHSTDAERVAALEEIRKWDPVRGAQLLKEGASDPDIKRMATVIVEQSDPPENVLSKLKMLPSVQIASVAQQRGLT